MIKVFALSIPLIIFLTLACNAQKPDDLYGWNKVKWGMTEQDIIKIYKDQVIRKKTTLETDLDCNLLIEKVKILDDSNGTVKVAFCLDNNTKLLTTVYISNIGLPPSIADRIKRRLIEKYGKYDDSELFENSLAKIDVYFWYFPSTTITLNINEINGEAIVSITYEKSKKEDKL